MGSSWTLAKIAQKEKSFWVVEMGDEEILVRRTKIA
jgi:hypothetical protein